MSYVPTVWVTGDVITAAKLNNGETGILDASLWPTKRFIRFSAYADIESALTGTGSVGQKGGIWQYVRSGGAGSSAYLYAESAYTFDWADFERFQCYARTSGNLSVQEWMRWGVGDLSANTTVQMSFEMYASTLRARVANGTTATTSDIFSSWAAQAQNLNRYRIDFDGTTASFYVDTGSGFPSSANVTITTNIPSTATAKSLGAFIHSEPTFGNDYTLRVAQMHARYSAL